MGDDDGLAVSAAIEALRAELELAWEAGAGHRVQFGVDEITLTLNVVTTGRKSGSGTVRWWVVEAGGDISHERAATQTLVLQLKPALVDPGTGQRSPLRVAADQERPGR